MEQRARFQMTGKTGTGPSGPSPRVIPSEYFSAVLVAHLPDDDACRKDFFTFFVYIGGEEGSRFVRDRVTM